MFAFIKFIRARGGNYPDQGLPPGELGTPDGPDNELPGMPIYPSVGPILPPRARPWPPLPWPPGDFPPTPTDPDWGVGAGVVPGQPIYIPPGRIDNELPPVAGTKPPTNPPPGTIWPPIAGAPAGKAAILVWVIGVGWRYFVVEVPPAVAAPK